MNDLSVSLDSINAAALRIEQICHHTPVLTCDTLDRLAGNQIFFKCEHLQKVGAFKFRGAYNAADQLDASQLKQGIITHSSGNHAQAVALSARLKNCPAYVIMPTNAPAPKIDAVREYGAEVFFCPPKTSAREQLTGEVQRNTGATFIPPYDHPSVISGQGTIGLELLKQIDKLDAIVAPIGGGGLISGVATAVKALQPKIQVFGAEPLGADDAARSLSTGRLIPQEAPNTIADGLLTSLGAFTWPIIQQQVDDIITVSEEQIIDSMRLVWERMKQLIEPSAAVAVAALMTPQAREQLKGARVAVILSGGNTNLKKLPWN